MHTSALHFLWHNFKTVLYHSISKLSWTITSPLDLWQQFICCCWISKWRQSNHTVMFTSVFFCHEKFKIYSEINAVLFEWFSVTWDMILALYFLMLSYLFFSNKRLLRRMTKMALKLKCLFSVDLSLNWSFLFF